MPSVIRDCRQRQWLWLLEQRMIWLNIKIVRKTTEPRKVMAAKVLVVNIRQKRAQSDQARIIT